MIDFKETKLPNGLQLIVHEDHSLPTVCLNILYKVGSKNEDPNQTGLAHLFEHLMFGGSKNISNFDEELQKVGGTNNAFTSPDLTNYHTIVPAINVETAFWLESDRMLSLSFEQKVLDTQKSVVIEEFKQTHLNRPYGDLWLKLLPMAYTKHPYQWATIGKEISHIESVEMENVKQFYEKYYQPANAILVVAGNIEFEKAHELANMWFGNIEGKDIKKNKIPQEPKQTSPRKVEVRGKVPHNVIYKSFHTPARLDNNYYSIDLLSDYLSQGESSILHQKLVKDKQLASSVNAYITGSVDPGQLIINATLNDDVSFNKIENEIDSIINEVQNNIDKKIVEKIKNQAETYLTFENVELLNRAYNLAYYSNLDDISLVNQQNDKIQKVTAENIQSQAQQILTKKNCTTLYYSKNEK